MPDLYVRSGGDAGAWTGTYASVALAAAADSPGDRIFVASDNAESLGATQTWAFAGTLASPVQVIAATTAAAPPTAVSTAAAVTTGASSYFITGNIYMLGMTLSAGTGAVNANITQDNGTTIPNSRQTYEDCNFQIVATGSNANIIIGGTANAYPSLITWRNCGLSFGNAAGRISLNLGEFVWEGGSILSGSQALTAGLIRPLSSGEYMKATISGVDLTNLGVTSFLVSTAGSGTVDVVFRNCKLPAWTTGGLVTGTINARDRVELYNCDSADTNYRVWIVDYTGSIVESTSVYNDAGADTTGIENANSDIAGFSWAMTTTADAKFPHMALRSPEIVKWNDEKTGTLTATVEIVHDSQGTGTAGALLDTEIWLEVMCLDPGGTPVGKWQSDRCANLNLNSNAADQASSAATWTGASGWDTQKLVVSFTPKEKGYVHARVMLAKASATVYVDPLLTIA